MKKTIMILGIILMASLVVGFTTIVSDTMSFFNQVNATQLYLGNGSVDSDGCLYRPAIHYASEIVEVPTTIPTLQKALCLVPRDLNGYDFWIKLKYTTYTGFENATLTGVQGGDAYNGGRLRAACQLLKEKYSQKDV